MTAKTISRIALAFAGLSVLALAIVLVLPLVASNMIGGARIVRELAERTGYRVTVGHAPEIVVWPRFRAVLEDVTLRDWGTDGAVVLSVERVDVDLSPLAILGGFGEFSSISLKRPVFAVVRRDGRYHLPPSTGAGRLEDAIERAGAEDVPNQQAMGSVTVTDGRVVDFADGTEIATALNGVAAWPTTDSAASLKADATWRGKNVSVSMSVATPMTLIRNGTSKLSFSLRSTEADINFTGSASDFAAPRFEGLLEASAPSLASALDWLDIRIGPAASLGKVSLTGQATGTVDHLSVSNAVVTLNDMPGAGALDFKLNGGNLAVAGTLAFDRLDMKPVFETNGSQNAGAMADLEFTNQFSADLRLSAAEAMVFGQALHNVAATVQVRPGFAAFDISDATVMDGTLQLALRGEQKAEIETIELRTSATGIDVASLLAFFDLRAEGVSAKTSFTASLSAPLSAPTIYRRVMTGNISGKLSEGSIKEFDISRLTGQSEDAGFFPLTAFGGNSTKLLGGEFAAELSAGAARLQKAQIETPMASIELDGVISYVGRSLALSGRVFEKQPAEPMPGGSLFFVGGSWDAPFITSASNR